MLKKKVINAKTKRRKIHSNKQYTPTGRFPFLHSLSFFIDLWFKYNTQYPLKIAFELLPLIAGYLWITFFFSMKHWSLERCLKNDLMREYDSQGHRVSEKLKILVSEKLKILVVSVLLLRNEIAHASDIL